MLRALANAAIRHPRRMALLALVVFALAGAFGATAVTLLNARNPFSDPSSPSARAEALLQQATGQEASPGVVALVTAPPGSPAVTSAARAIAGVPGVAAVAAPGPGHTAGLVSADGRSSLVVVTLRAAPDPDTVVAGIQTALHGRPDVLLGGADVAGVETGKQATADLGLAEAIAFPLLAILALLIFRGIAALLPIAVGGMTVMGTFCVLRLVNTVLPLSVFALNLVIGLGLGLAVDYSLFLVWRFREELREGTPESALRVTMATTGRTVLFSAATVAAAMASLAVFPQRFLVSMGIGGATVAVVAAASALLIVPSLLMLLRRRIGRVAPAQENGRWYRLANVVMRRPALVAGGTVLGLLTIAAPTLGVHWTGIDVTVLPASSSARTVSDTLARDFPATSSGNSILVVASGPASDRPALTRYAGRLARLPGVAAASAPAQVAPRTWEITLASPSDPLSAAGQHTLKAVRAAPAPAPVLVGGGAADFADRGASLLASLPIALAILAVVTMAVLWLMTGSVVLPVMSLLMNALTAVAATGLLVFIFQDGRLHRAARLHQPGRHRGDRLPDPGRHGLRLVHRLRGVPAGPDQRGTRPGRGRAGGDRRGHAAVRQADHPRGAPARRGHGCLRDFQAHLPQGGRRRRRRRRAHRCLHRADAVVPRPDGAARTPQLVGAARAQDIAPQARRLRSPDPPGSPDPASALARPPVTRAALTAGRADWRDDAACGRLDPELFFPISTLGAVSTAMMSLLCLV